MEKMKMLALLIGFILLMGCSSTSSDSSATKIQISDLWNSQQNEFTLPGISMSSTGDEIKSHYGVSELILYQSTATIEENGDKLIYATISLGSSEIKAVVDFMWRDGAISMQNLIEQEETADVMYSQKVEDQYPTMLDAGLEESFSGACLLLDGVYYYPGEDSLLERFEINDADNVKKYGHKLNYGNVEHITAYDGDVYALWCYERQEYAVFKLDKSGTISKVAESDEMDYLALGFYATQKGIIITLVEKRHGWQ